MTQTDKHQTVQRATDRIRLGIDSSDRPIVVTRRMHAAFLAALVLLDFEPVIIQGAFMARVGGGAVDSAGTHDRAGCLDTRTEGLTSHQQMKVVRAARSVGWAVWKRDKRHGNMEQHHHWLLLGEPKATPAARLQMRAYRAGLDGLDPERPDYHWRPDPLPVFHYRAAKHGGVTVSAQHGR